jgi:glucosamine-6-phosphate deaminase
MLTTQENVQNFSQVSVKTSVGAADLYVFENEADLGEAAAEMLAKQLRQNPASVWLLPTGRTPLAMYRDLVVKINGEKLDVSRLRTFNLDEFYGLPAVHPGSYHSYMQNALFGHISVNPENIKILDGETADPVAECAAYEAAIIAAGGVDLAVLGIGANGHIGFNEPGSDFESRTRLVEIQSETRQANAIFFDNKLEDVPAAALTSGIATIMDARQILLLATGASKADAVYAMLHGEITPDVPASVLRRHRKLTIMVDRAAAVRVLPI